MDQRAQISWPVLLVLGAGIVLTLSLGILHSNAVLLAAYATLVVCWFLFPTRTVSMDDDSVEIRFGIGLLRKGFKFSEIESSTVVRNPWWWRWTGLGMTRVPQGWLLYVGGRDAVELLMNNGTVYRISTHDPQALNQSIQSRLREVAQPVEPAAALEPGLAA